MQSEDVLQLKKEKIFLIRKRRFIIDNYIKLFSAKHKQSLEEIDRRLDQIDLMLIDPYEELIAKALRKAQASISMAPKRK